MQYENQYFIFDTPKTGSVKERIRTALYTLKAGCWKLKMNLQRPKDPGEKKYNVSFCTIFKNEGPYLKEWIEYHKVVGIDHFYLYNNNSEDDFRSVLQPYVDSGLVTLLDWPYNQAQMACYKDCVKRFRGETKWLGFIDLDEFVTPKSTDDVYSFLQPFEKNRGAVMIYWKLFGTSGRFQRDMDGLVAEDFTVCWKKYCDIGKCFYNTRYGFNEDSPRNGILHHRFCASLKGKDIPPVNLFDKVCCGNLHVATQADFPIQINHYFTKSYKEYAMKRSKGDVYFKINPHDEEYFYHHEMKCTDTDHAAYKYLIKLKKAMDCTGK